LKVTGFRHGLTCNLQFETFNQFRKPAVRTNSVRVFAKIADDLDQTLLVRRTFQNPWTGSSQQTLPRQFQNGIILRRRPREKPALDFALKFFIAAFLGSNP
jgi:hypothetical protein